MVLAYIYKRIPEEFIKFCCVGVLNTLINYGVYLGLLLLISSHYLIAGSFGFLAGALCGFFANKKWTFKQSQLSNRFLLPYILVNITSLGINLFVQYLVVNFLNIPEVFSQIFAIFITTLTNYFGVKYFVFNQKSVVE